MCFVTSETVNIFSFFTIVLFFTLQVLYKDSDFWKILLPNILVSKPLAYCIVCPAWKPSHHVDYLYPSQSP
jgi:hypothetical protein